MKRQQKIKKKNLWANKKLVERSQNQLSILLAKE